MAADRWLVAFPLALLAACGGGQQADTGVAPLPEPKPVPASADATAALGLTPLPTPQQVVTAVPQGRPDPFAPPPVVATTARGTARRQVRLPSDLRLHGVIVTGGQPRALVERGDRSGSLGLGDRGLAGSDGLLPPGWVVAAISARECVLTLRQGKLRAEVRCPSMGL